MGNVVIINSLHTPGNVTADQFPKTFPYTKCVKVSNVLERKKKPWDPNDGIILYTIHLPSSSSVRSNYNPHLKMYRQDAVKQISHL